MIDPVSGASENNPSLKRCPKCNQEHPATTEYFHRQRKAVDGWQRWCKQCRKENDHQRYEKRTLALVNARASQQSSTDQGKKFCPGCKNTWPATTEYYNHDKSREDGWQNRCKACQSAYSREYRKRPQVLGHTRTRIKNWRSQNREWVRIQNGIYRARRSSVRQPRVRQPRVHQRSSDALARRRTYNKIYLRRYRTLPEKHALIRSNRHNRDARKKGTKGTYTAEQIQGLLIRQCHRCYYCSAKFEHKNGKYIYHIDHTFPLSRASGDDPINDISYLVLACPTCNIRKGNKYPWEWIDGGRLL